MTRAELQNALRHALNAQTDIELMNVLQDRGLVSDEAVHLCDVPEEDLKSALEKATNL